MAEQPTQREYWSGKVGDAWAANAAQTDAMLHPLTEAALELGAFKPGERVLDIGCGAGWTSLEIARRVGSSGAVVGVDLSPQLLNLAQTRASETGLPATFIETDAGAASFEQKFDAAFSRFGVMFFEAPVDAFTNIRAALRPGGRLIFVCWRAMTQNIWGTHTLDAVRPMLKTPLPPPDPDAPGPYAFADEQKVQRILREAGWSDIAMSTWDGSLLLGGGGGVAEAADFVMQIGPGARVIADQQLDADEARQRIIDSLAPLHNGQGVSLPAACWLVTANA
jgi:SAM-dependent methyltransferase